nr:MAG TPA: Transcriptional regulator regulator, helix-turn-helix, TetR-family, TRANSCRIPTION [Caudoviricetes sp.]
MCSKCVVVHTLNLQNVEKSTLVRHFCTKTGLIIMYIKECHTIS